MTYRMDDGTVVKTENATKIWNEDTRHDGRNYISVATGAQWSHETLYCSRKGRYWIESYSDYQGSTPHAEWISNRSAAQWLLANDHELPKNLAALEAEVSE
jgi:hypothetical protein